MGLLRLMHLRKLVPLSDLLAGRGAVPPAANVSASAPGGRYGATAPKLAGNSASGGGPASRTAAAPVAARTVEPVKNVASAAADSGFKDRFLAEVKAGKSTFYNLVVASAFRIEASPAGVTFSFLPNQKNAKSQCEEQKAWLASIAEKVAGKPVPLTVNVAESGATPSPAPASSAPANATPAGGDLNSEAMANSTVQAVLEIFPVEKTTVEER
jgi:hypothetical protein